MEKNMSVCAVIVTFNRKEYLLKLLNALTIQTVKLTAIVIFDNKSNDGTDASLLREGYISSIKEAEVVRNMYEDISVYYYKNSENSGGSGGFYAAIDMASKLDCGYLWCMDDDVLPDNDCLEVLLKNIDDNCSVCIPTRTDNSYSDFAVTHVNMSNPFKYSIVSRKTMLTNDKITGDYVFVEDMPFEGPLISNDIVKKIGLPNKDFFIIFDDSEYAKRAARFTKIKYCKRAVLHKQIIPSISANIMMNWKNYYGFRNQIWFDRHYGENWLVRVLRPRFLYVDLMLRALVTGKTTNVRVIKRAYKDGINDKLGKLVEPGTHGDQL